MPLETIIPLISLTLMPSFLGFGGLAIATSASLLVRGRQKRYTNWTHGVLFGSQCLLVSLAIVFFCIALFEPSCENFWIGPPSPGLLLLLMGFPFWGINLFFLLSPLVLLWLYLAKIRGLEIIPLLLQCGCALVATRVAPLNARFPGPTHWLIAHWLLTAAYAIPSSLTLRSEPPEQPGRALTFPRPALTPLSKPL